MSDRKTKNQIIARRDDEAICFVCEEIAFPVDTTGIPRNDKLYDSWGFRPDTN